VDSRSWWSAGDGGINLSLRVTAGARRSEVIGASGDRLRVRIATPAIEGKANAELRRMIASLFGVRRSAVSLVRGDRSREKTLWVAGISKPPPEMLGED
jgi:uncharacterized protein (TIGR00251 family)